MTANANTKRSTAKALLDIGAVGFSPQAPITFKSGILSPVYVDNRQLIYHPRAWHTVIEGFQATIKNLALDAELIAGVAVGGVPHSSALAYAMNTPSLFIRKESKGHGKTKRIEGGPVKRKKVVLLEDLVTTGGSSFSAVRALRQAGAIVSDLIAIVSYGFDEADRAFEQAGVNLHTLTDFETLLDIALARGLFTDAEARLIQDWFADPHGWGKTCKQ